jgi:hypothetical protein
LAVIRFEHRASYLLGRHSTTGGFVSVSFWIDSYIFAWVCSQTVILPPLPSTYLGLHNASLFFGLFIEMGSVNFLHGLASNYNPPNLCLSSS